MSDLGRIVSEILELAGMRPSSVSFLELDRSGLEEPLVAVLAFVDDAPEPAAFIKLTPDPNAVAALDREYGNLVRLTVGLPDSMRMTVPRPLYRGQVRELGVLAETVLPGARLKNLPSRWFQSGAFPAAFERVMDWLDDFSTCAALASSEQTPGPAAEIVERYRSRFDRSPGADQMLDKAVESLSETRLPAIPTHGDFCVENVLVEKDGSVGVIDWEHPLEGGWPLVDLLHFAASLWCIPHGKSMKTRLDNHRQLFFVDHPRRELFRSRMAEHLRRLGIASEYVVALSAVAWAHQANRKMRGQSPAAGPPDVMPRIFIEDRRCLNLEMLAEGIDSYVFTGLAPRQTS